jgi:hypothetical protein
VSSVLLRRSLSPVTLVVAVDSGKVSNRVWLSTDAAGLVAEPLSLPVLRPGLEELDRLVRRHAGAEPPVFAIEATAACSRHGSAS